ncbi:MAG: acetate/propionate family kinase [Burkholderiales bacterium]
MDGKLTRMEHSGVPARAILVINAGSSSIKFALFGWDQQLADTAVLHGQIDGIGEHPRFTARDAQGGCPGASGASYKPRRDHDPHGEALRFLLDWLETHAAHWQVAAAGHRVVHGGEGYSDPVVVSDKTLSYLETLVPLAPLHQPHNLAAIHALRRTAPALPQVACFDTAFHRSQDVLAQMFALPQEYTQAGIKRYGFHGLSYEHIASVLPSYLGELAGGRVVVAHLGAGASMCALLDRKSVMSTMGFTPLDGLVMSTRCGALDAGVVLHLLKHHGMHAQAIEDLLYHRSGLLGVSGLSGDMRVLLASQEVAARTAIELFVYRASLALGSLAAALGGLDALVFTGGIGENSAEIRQLISHKAGWLGVRLDEAANSENASRISLPSSPVTTLVIPANEERIIAEHTAALLIRENVWR